MIPTPIPAVVIPIPTPIPLIVIPLEVIPTPLENFHSLSYIIFGPFCKTVHYLDWSIDQTGIVWTGP